MLEANQSWKYHLNFYSQELKFTCWRLFMTNDEHSIWIFNRRWWNFLLKWRAEKWAAKRWNWNSGRWSRSLNFSQLIQLNQSISFHFFSCATTALACCSSFSTLFKNFNVILQTFFFYSPSPRNINRRQRTVKHNFAWWTNYRERWIIKMLLNLTSVQVLNWVWRKVSNR